MDIPAKIITNENISNTLSKAKDTTELIEYYQKYIKRSYAKCSSLQTISKDRILKKNKLDPVGKVKVSNNTLDAINRKLKELYLF